MFSGSFPFIPPGVGVWSGWAVIWLSAVQDRSQEQPLKGLAPSESAPGVFEATVWTRKVKRGHFQEGCGEQG